MRYKDEKTLLLEKMWEMVLRETKVEDDAGCDWFTMGNNTYIAHTNWCVSSDPDVANMVNAICCLNEWYEFIDVKESDAPMEEEWNHNPINIEV